MKKALRETQTLRVRCL